MQPIHIGIRCTILGKKWLRGSACV